MGTGGLNLPPLSPVRGLSTKCSPAGALTMSSLNTDTVLGITLSIAFSRLH